MFDIDIMAEMGHARHQRFIKVAEEDRRLRQRRKHHSIFWLPLMKLIVQLFHNLRSQ